MENKQHYHVWQDHGFVPPFKLVHVYSIPSRALAEANPDAYNRQLADMPKGCGIGSCAICGMSLVNNFVLIDSSNRKFSVGCECVKKHGDTQLITLVEAEQKKIDKAKRQAAAAKKREAKEAAYRAELDAQRQRNGGMTDYELESHNRQQAENARKQSVVSILAPVIVILKSKNTNFCVSVVSDLESGYVHNLSPRAIDIIDDICSKSKLENAADLIDQAKLIK